MKKSLKQSKVRGMALALSLTMAAGSMPVFAAGGSGSTSSNTSGSTGTTTGGSTSSGSTSGSTNSGSTSTALTKALEEARKAVKSLKTSVEAVKEDADVKKLTKYATFKTELDKITNAETATTEQILAVKTSLEELNKEAKSLSKKTDTVTALKELQTLFTELDKLNETTSIARAVSSTTTTSAEETKINAALTSLATSLGVTTKVDTAADKAAAIYPTTGGEVADTEEGVELKHFKKALSNAANLEKVKKVKEALDNLTTHYGPTSQLQLKLNAVIKLAEKQDLLTVINALTFDNDSANAVKNFKNAFDKLKELNTAIKNLITAQNELKGIYGSTEGTVALKKEKIESLDAKFKVVKNLELAESVKTLEATITALEGLKTQIGTHYTQLYQKIEDATLKLDGETDSSFTGKKIKERLTELKTILTGLSSDANYSSITRMKVVVDNAIEETKYLVKVQDFETNLKAVRDLKTAVISKKSTGDAEVTKLTKVKKAIDATSNIKSVSNFSNYVSKNYFTELETELDKAKSALENEPKLTAFDAAAKELVTEIKNTNKETNVNALNTALKGKSETELGKLLEDTKTLNTKLNAVTETTLSKLKTKSDAYNTKLTELKTVTDTVVSGFGAAITTQEANLTTLNKASELKTKIDNTKTKVTTYDNIEKFKSDLTTTSTALTKLAEEAKEVTLTFNIEGTNVELKVTTQDFTTESTTLADIVKAKGDDKIKNPTKAGGYEFAEWKKTTTTGSTTSSVKYDLTTLTKAEFLKLTEGFTLTASFKSVRNITFNTGVTETTEKIKFEDADFSTTSATLSTILTSKGKTSLITPTRAGYEFTGWYTTDASGAKVAVDFTKINSAKFLELKENATFTAEWKAVRNVTFTNGEEGSSKKEVTLKLEETTFNGGKTLKDIVEANTEIAKLNKDGYFISWFLTGQDKATDLSTITASTFTTLATTTSVFTAKYNLKTYKVTLSVNADKEQTKELTVTNGQILNSIYTVPTKANYTFAGWYTDASFSTKFDSSKAFNLDKDITLYAKWNKTDSSSSNSGSSSSSGSTGGGSASVSSSGGSSSNTSQGNKVNEENKTEVKEETTNQEETKVEETTNQKETNKTNNETKQPVVLTKEQLNLPKVNTEKVVSYSDTKNVSWAQESIEKLSKAGILNGNQDGTFSPNAASKRADVVIMFTKLLGLENQGVSGNNFTDVSKDKYYAKYLLVAKEFGLINGYSDGSFKPENTISRQDVMVLAVNVLKSLGFELNTNTSVLNKFSDANKISAYAKENVAILVNAGIISGSNGKINPTADITRAEMSVIVSRIYDLAAERVANLNLEQILETEETANAEATTTEMTTTETKN